MLCTLNEDILQSDRCGFLNSNRTFNFSLEEALNILFEYRKSGRNLNETAETILIIVYSLLIVVGVCANLLVCFVVARKSQMHTPRNLYIVNLSISDMTMCVICMPFTLITILRREWRLGSLLCKLVPVLEGTNIMISIGTITMIALDRYYTIVRRHNSANSRTSVVICIMCVWTFSLLATSPLAFYQVVQPISFHKVILYDACIEKWPSHNFRIIYTACILLVQAVIPALVVSVVHVRIASYLHSHTMSHTDARKAQRDLQRNKKTTLLLLGVAVLFLASWLPFSLFSLVADVMYPPESASNVSAETLYLIFAICHVIAMSSAVSNPIVYGWLNMNIRFEFLQLFVSKYADNGFNRVTDEQTTTKTMLATSSHRKSGPTTLQLRPERSERSNHSPPALHMDSFML